MIAGRANRQRNAEPPQHTRNVRATVGWSIFAVAIAAAIAAAFIHKRPASPIGVGAIHFHSAAVASAADAAVGAGQSIPTPTAFLTPHQPRASANAVTTATLTMVRPGTSSNRGILVSS